MSEGSEKLPKAFFNIPRVVYTRLGRVIKRFKDRVYFTEDEVQYMIDIVDVWIEGHRDLDPEDDEVQSLFDNMSVAIDVRNKLWRQLNE